MQQSQDKSYQISLYLKWYYNFWVLNLGGWAAFAVFTYSSFTLPYEQEDLPYIVHPWVQSIIGVCLTWVMREIYHFLWHSRAGLRIFAGIATTLVFSALWTVLRLYTFLRMTGEEVDLVIELPSWYYPGLLLFSLWTALYHAIKYAQLLQEEHRQLLQAQMRSRGEQLRRLEAESVARDAQLRMLRYQLNPHFLFNTLNAISSLVSSGRAAAANQMIDHLSRFLRYSLDSDQVDFVTVGQELEALRLYLTIEKTRFGDRLELTFDEADDVKDLTMPGFLLQPLIENSIKYAIAPAVDGGEIRVTARREGGRLCITVEDSGAGSCEAEAGVAPGRGVGLNNIRERLAAVYGDDYEFELTNRDAGGTQARLCLPVVPALDGLARAGEGVVNA